MAQKRFVVLGGLILLLYRGISWADCQLHYDEAIHLLQSTQEKISQESHPNPDAFSKGFQEIIERMQREQCLSELKKLVQHIDDEQKKYPLPSGKKHQPIPVMD